MILPKHLEDLQRSGLTYDTIAAMKCRSLSNEEIMQILPGALGLLEFPYPGLNDFSRYKIFPPRSSGQKYHQQAGTGCHLYILNSVRKDLTDASVALHFTEGEKKAAAGVQLGLAMIGLAGLWNFRDTETGALITELTNGIVWADR